MIIGGHRTTEPYEIVLEARQFAIFAHGEQKYWKYPYVYHLDCVVANLKNYSDEERVIGYLHDVVEDTEVTIAHIQNKFSIFVADCVYLISDPPGLKNRKEKKESVNRTLSQISGVSPYNSVLIVKAADRLANLRMDKKFDMYKKEHEAFKLAAYRPGLCEDLWEMIEILVNSK